MRIYYLLSCLLPLFTVAQFNNSMNAYADVEYNITYSNSSKKLYPSVIGGVKTEKTGLAFLTFGIISQTINLSYSFLNHLKK